MSFPYTLLFKYCTDSDREQDAIFWKSVWNPWNSWSPTSVEKIPIRHMVILKSEVCTYNHLSLFWKFCPKWCGAFFLFEHEYHPIVLLFFKWEGCKTRPSLHLILCTIFKVNLSNIYSTLICENKVEETSVHLPILTGNEHNMPFSPEKLFSQKRCLARYSIRIIIMIWLDFHHRITSESLFKDCSK